MPQIKSNPCRSVVPETIQQKYRLLLKTLLFPFSGLPSVPLRPLPPDRHRPLAAHSYHQSLHLPGQKQLCPEIPAG